MSLIAQPSSKYPGNRGEFELTGGYWQLTSGRRVVRQMIFTSCNQDSLFSEVRLLGFRVGTLALEVDFRTAPSEAVHTYFAAHLETPYQLPNPEKNTFYATGVNLPKLFQLIIENNTFDPEYCEVLSEFINKKDWTQVTPLRKGERFSHIRSDA